MLILSLPESLKMALFRSYLPISRVQVFQSGIQALWQTKEHCWGCISYCYPLRYRIDQKKDAEKKS